MTTPGQMNGTSLVIGMDEKTKVTDLDDRPKKTKIPTNDDDDAEDEEEEYEDLKETKPDTQNVNKLNQDLNAFQAHLRSLSSTSGTCCMDEVLIGVKSGAQNGRVAMYNPSCQSLWKHGQNMVEFAFTRGRTTGWILRPFWEPGQPVQFQFGPWPEAIDSLRWAMFHFLMDVHDRPQVDDAHATWITFLLRVQAPNAVIDEWCRHAVRFLTRIRASSGKPKILSPSLTAYCRMRGLGPDVEQRATDLGGSVPSAALPIPVWIIVSAYSIPFEDDQKLMDRLVAEHTATSLMLYRALCTRIADQLASGDDRDQWMIKSQYAWERAQELGDGYGRAYSINIANKEQTPVIPYSQLHFPLPNDPSPRTRIDEYDQAVQRIDTEAKARVDRNRKDLGELKMADVIKEVDMIRMARFQTRYIESHRFDQHPTVLTLLKSDRMSFSMILHSVATDYFDIKTDVNHTSSGMPDLVGLTLPDERTLLDQTFRTLPHCLCLQTSFQQMADRTLSMYAIAELLAPQCESRANVTNLLSLLVVLTRLGKPMYGWNDDLSFLFRSIDRYSMKGSIGSWTIGSWVHTKRQWVPMD